LVSATFLYGSQNGDLFRPAGIRGDLIGGVLVFVGLVLGVLFLFQPRRRPADLPVDPGSNELTEALRYENGQVLLAQILVGVGLAFLIIDALWTLYWLRNDYLTDSSRESSLGGLSLPTYLALAPLALIGSVIVFFFLGKLGASRRARNPALVAVMRRGSAADPAAKGALGSGVTEPEVQALMKRLDGLMAQLPDSAVTEFSKSPEADTYLKLLGP
ncbi:MAG: hypothetical protein ABR586_06165, partial [Thermoplasmatota archaeon]